MHSCSEVESISSWIDSEKLSFPVEFLSRNSPTITTGVLPRYILPPYFPRFLRWCNGILGFGQEQTSIWKYWLPLPAPPNRMAGPSKSTLPKLSLKVQIPGFELRNSWSRIGGWVFRGIFILKKYLHRLKEEGSDKNNDCSLLIPLRESRPHCKEKSEPEPQTLSRGLWTLYVSASHAVRVMSSRVQLQSRVFLVIHGCVQMY